jgi:hypothetical protein
MIKDKNSLWWFPNAILSQQLHGKGKMGIHSEVALDTSSTLRPTTLNSGSS